MDINNNFLVLVKMLLYSHNSAKGCLCIKFYYFYYFYDYFDCSIFTDTYYKKRKDERANEDEDT